MPIIFVAHIVEQDFGIGVKIRRSDAHKPTRFAAHGADMHLKTFASKSGGAVITHGGGQEVILDIGIINSCVRANKPAGFKMVGGTKTSSEHKPLQADFGFVEKTQLAIERYGLQAAHLHINF